MIYPASTLLGAAVGSPHMPCSGDWQTADKCGLGVEDKADTPSHIEGWISLLNSKCISAPATGCRVHHASTEAPSY